MKQLGIERGCPGVAKGAIYPAGQGRSPTGLGDRSEEGGVGDHQGSPRGPQAAEESKEGAAERLVRADRSRWVGSRPVEARVVPGWPRSSRGWWRGRGLPGRPGRTLGNRRPGHRGAGAAAGPGARGAAPWPSPHFRKRRGPAPQPARRAASPRAARAGERAARPQPRRPHSRVSPCRHGRVRAAPARGDHGGAGLWQGHRVVAHHPTL